MDKNNAVRNQKVFVTLESVLELQERLREAEARYKDCRAAWEIAPIGREKEIAVNLMHTAQRVVDVLSGVVKCLDLPIALKVNRG